MRKKTVFSFFIVLIAVSLFSTQIWSKEDSSKKGKNSTTRYAAKIVRKTLAPEGDPLTEPTLRFPDDKTSWKIVKGDAFTGNNRHEYFFTIEADSQKLPAPKIELIWPGVEIAKVFGARGPFQKIPDGISFTPSGSRVPTHVGTSFQYGAVRMQIMDNWFIRKTGPYRSRPWPANAIRAQINYLFAAREMCRAMGFTQSEDPGFNGYITLYGFETNYPNGHVDCPPHFHIMLAWKDWTGTNAGHFLLDEEGKILVNNLQRYVDGKFKGFPFKPGESAPFYDADGKVGFETEILPDGSGVIMRRDKKSPEYLIRAGKDSAMKSIDLLSRKSADQPWTFISNTAADDNRDKAVLRIKTTSADGKINEEIYPYDIDTGKILK
ncbi:MAG: hypothetical protein Q4G69_12695 [Planctomycetia bacterium]|nr:hypothetical protein [Planctomycetia bacterium]